MVHDPLAIWANSVEVVAEVFPVGECIVFVVAPEEDKGQIRQLFVLEKALLLERLNDNGHLICAVFDGVESVGGQNLVQLDSHI